MPGRSIGSYLLLEKLGAGGMGEVYLADDTRLGRKVALKTLLDTDIQSGEARRRLLHEARAAATLNHPNIASIYDIIEADDHTHIVMEYVRGESLGARLRRERMPPEQVLDIGTQLSDSLVEAHRHGVVHRDLKPGNVCLTPEGRVKVLDFGLAKMRPVQHTEVPGDPASLYPPLSQAGQIFGTPGYTAPEQLLGKTVDNRSDLYSLGVLLFELCTGRRPFEAPEPLGTALASLTEPTPLAAEVEPTVPADLSAIIGRMMAKEPAHRSSVGRIDVKRPAQLGDRAQRAPNRVGLEPRAPFDAAAWPGHREAVPAPPRLCRCHRRGAACNARVAGVTTRAGESSCGAQCGRRADRRRPPIRQLGQ